MKRFGTFLYPGTLWSMETSPYLPLVFCHIDQPLETFFHDHGLGEDEVNQGRVVKRGSLFWSSYERPRWIGLLVHSLGSVSVPSPRPRLLSTGDIGDGSSRWGWVGERLLWDLERYQVVDSQLRTVYRSREDGRDNTNPLTRTWCFWLNGPGLVLLLMSWEQDVNNS